MSRDERKLPPGPNPRGDRMTEKDQRQLRDFMRQKSAPGEADEEWEGPDKAEGERNGEHSLRVRHTPDQAEGERETVDKELHDKKLD
jgi:hypothetical protein